MAVIFSNDNYESVCTYWCRSQIDHQPLQRENLAADTASFEGSTRFVTCILICQGSYTRDTKQDDFSPLLQ